MANMFGMMMFAESGKEQTMTLDETIKEAKITAILFENEARKYTMRNSSFYEEQAKAFRESAREFKQTAEWLEELKAYREVYDTAGRPQGEWIDKGYYAECSNCGAHSGTQYDGIEPIPRKTKFCPDCGRQIERSRR